MQMAHDLLIRALLAQLARSEPQAFGQIGASLASLKLFRDGGGELPREVSQEIAAILGEINRSVARRT